VEEPEEAGGGQLGVLMVASSRLLGFAAPDPCPKPLPMLYHRVMIDERQRKAPERQQGRRKGN
jgi:hypothetical protein